MREINKQQTRKRDHCQHRDVNLGEVMLLLPVRESLRTRHPMRDDGQGQGSACQAVGQQVQKACMACGRNRKQGRGVRCRGQRGGCYKRRPAGWVESRSQGGLSATGQNSAFIFHGGESPGWLLPRHRISVWRVHCKRTAARREFAQ